MRLLVVILVLGLIALSGVALASDTADMVRPHLNRLINGVERTTGWDCHYLIRDTSDLFATLVWCEK